MDHLAGAEHCAACRDHAGRARSVAALVAAEPGARFLDADADTLALILPQLEAATATTVGRAALLSEPGGYAQPRKPGGRVSSPPGRIAIRLAPGLGEQLAYTPVDPARRRPAALYLFDRAGTLAHRTEVAAPDDLMTLAAFMAEFPARAPVFPAMGDAAPAMPYLPAIRHARDTWDAAEVVRHLDDLLRDGGHQRRACLPHLGGAVARRIDPVLIGHLLREVARRGLPFRRVAVRPGCLQTQEGALSLLRPEGDMLLLRSGAGTMALDLAGVADAWVTCLGPAGARFHALELYEPGGQCAAAFLPPAQGAAEEAAAWDALVRSLPAAPMATRISPEALG